MHQGSRKRGIRIAIALIILAFLAIGILFAGRQAVQSFFYPKPTAMPAVVAKGTDELLAQLQATLEKHAPDLAKALQPGLSDAQIAELETKGGFKLSPDLRTLYRWHNGTGTNQNVTFLLLNEFPSLDDIVKEIRAERGQTNLSAAQSAAVSVLISHRAGWVPVFPDVSGDGYFYDPNRSEKDGSFFDSFAEMRTFLWFPSFRNFLAGAIECYEADAFKPTKDQQELLKEGQKAEEIWARYGVSSD